MSRTYRNTPDSDARQARRADALRRKVRREERALADYAITLQRVYHLRGAQDRAVQS